MRALVGCLAAGLCSGGAASAQGFFDTIQTDAEAKAVAVVSPGRDDAGGIEAETALFETSLSGEVDGVLRNGAEVGVRGAVRVQRDHPARPGFSGSLGDPFAPALSASTALALRGAFSGLADALPLEDQGVRASVESAFAYIEGGYGELVVGRDLGVAARFHAGAPDVFTHARSVNPYLDPSGVTVARTVNDVMGPSFRVSYATPRLLGVRLGVSYAPTAENNGLDRDAEAGAPGVADLDLRNGVDVALSVSRRIGGDGPRLRVSADYSRAGVRGPADTPPREAVGTFSVGAELEGEALSFGGSYLTSDNGGGGRYQAWSAGAVYRAFKIDWGVSYAEARDDLAALSGRGWSAGARREIVDDHVTLALGVQEQILDRAGAPPVSSLGPVIEITLGL